MSTVRAFTTFLALIVVMSGIASAQQITMSNPHTGEVVAVNATATERSLTALAVGDQRLRILVLGNGFTESQEWMLAAKAAEFRAELVSLEPFNRASERIEVEVRRSSQDLGCHISGRQLACSGSLAIAEARASGDYDELFILDNRSEYGGSAWMDGGQYRTSGSLDTFCQATFGSSVGVMVHEFGHCFGSLQDEYLYSHEATADIPTNSVNCVANPAELVGGYTQGCGRNASYYRPAEESTMLNERIRGFNRVSIESEGDSHGLVRRLEHFVGGLGPEVETLPAPTNLRATVNGNQVSLAWDSNLNSFQVQVGFTPGFANPVTNFATFSRSISASANPGAYYVRVIAVVGTQRSAPSNEVMVVVGGCNLPATPTNLRATVNGNQVSLAWDPSPDATSYTVSALMGGAQVYDQNVGLLTSVQASGVPAGTYFVDVRARNTCGPSRFPVTRTVVVP